MAVRIRLKKMGRAHRPFFRVCAMDSRSARDGKVIEELGYYDPMVRETDARAVLNSERIAYWLGVGAQPTEKVGVLIKKYGPEGTHLEQQKAALERLAARTPSPLLHAPPAAPKAAEPQSAEPAAAEPEAVEASSAEAASSEAEGGESS